MKKIFFLRLCLCIFESDTVKSDCQVQIFRKMMKYLKMSYRLLVYLKLLVLLFVLEILKEKRAENDQSKKTRGPEGPEALT